MVAAAAVLVIAAAAAFVVTRDGHERVESGPAPGRSSEGSTGWYIPADRPPGWRVHDVYGITNPVDEECRCETARWVTRNGSEGLLVQRTRTLPRGVASPTDLLDKAVPETDLTAGVRGLRLDDDKGTEVVWESKAGWIHAFASTGARQILLDLIDTWNATPVATDLADPAGLVADFHSVVGDDVVALTEVVIDVGTDGQPIPIVLSPGSTRGPTSAFDLSPMALPGVDRTGYLEPWGDGEAQFFATWPGASVRTGASMFEGNPATTAEVETVVRSLRPATSKEWAAFVRSTTHDPQVIAPRLDDLVFRAGDPLPDNDPAMVDGDGTSPSVGTSVPGEEPPAPTATTGPGLTTTTSATVPFQPGPSSSANRELPSRWPAAAREQLDDLTGLRFTLTLERAEVVSGSSVRAQVTATNESDHEIRIGECTALSTAAGLVPTTSTASLPLPELTDCYRQTTTLTVPAGETAAWPVDLWPTKGITARTIEEGTDGQRLGGTLAPGPYLAAVDVPGRTSTVRVAVPVTVTPHPCGGFDAAFVSRYVPGSVAEARSQAANDGLEFRIVEVGGRVLPHFLDLHCNRIDASVSGDRVLSVDIG